MDTVIVCSLCLGGYVVGISLFARNESKRRNHLQPPRYSYAFFSLPAYIGFGCDVEPPRSYPSISPEHQRSFFGLD